MSFRNLLSALAVTVIATNIAVAAPFKTKGRRFIAAPLPVAPIYMLTDGSKLFTPVTALPGTIGTIRYNSDGRCLVIVMGGAPTNADMVELLSKEGDPVLPNFNDSHTAYMCPGAKGGTVVTMLNYRGLRQIYQGSPDNSNPSSNPGSILVSYWNQPNLLASASLGNRVTERGVRFISNAYDLVFGTDANAKAFFVIIDHSAKKLINFTEESGGYYGDLTTEMVSLYNNTLGVSAVLAPKIVLFNN